MIQASDVKVNITNCVINGCSAAHGTGMYLSGAGSGSVKITRTIIENCITIVI